MILRFFLRIVGYFPLPVLHGIGWVAGWMMWLIPNSQRRTAIQQVRWCLPKLSIEEQNKIIRDSLISIAKAVTEAPAFWYGPLWRIKRWIQNDDVLELFRELTQNATQATIFLTPHLGAWELSSFAASQVGPITVLYKPQTRGNGIANTLMNPGRERLSNVSLASTDAGGVRLLMQALKRQEMIGVLPDHDPPENAGQFAPFFGRPAHTINLISKLAEKTQAPVFFFVVERLSWARGYRYHCIQLPETITDPNIGVEVMNQVLEECIMRWPGQYWWGYKRFRRLPEGVESPYKK